MGYTDLEQRRQIISADARGIVTQVLQNKGSPAASCPNLRSGARFGQPHRLDSS
jgi:hypothetical protein